MDPNQQPAPLPPLPQSPQTNPPDYGGGYDGNLGTNPPQKKLTDIFKNPKFLFVALGVLLLLGVILLFVNSSKSKAPSSYSFDRAISLEEELLRINDLARENTKEFDTLQFSANVDILVESDVTALMAQRGIITQAKKLVEGATAGVVDDQIEARLEKAASINRFKSEYKQVMEKQLTTNLSAFESLEIKYKSDPKLYPVIKQARLNLQTLLEEDRQL